ncbi:N-acetyl-1-D-myo-inositol-2-amino-2-deoxy-alpha-D-glucopyranoside deacetylase [Mycobacterium sp. MYCO198283]|uniref:N-acetyl-1-D-myo-inositol-2-amino-2-deoxy-alpha- D-glucopyranoside deacetylase n=1 Tax=Mycobacterium sp. MYCO198283 TaxID=2883505 RepID=UPI001E57E59B|nr:N-acetyl-1-D-myo-inositol-2-amino-2-deoxy-alpha-D-glucopyranoside deacetylase [Mycobacterium sp. MYCO198283]MCG5430803.1 N-acetyl-1-D-myo-inositol-2-amino-2-deoxy-alpha-D-glucopyranoside deacetylase [Mycobacterium sp. MYCO198283]
MPDSPRLLFVHAHPDDETITTGATIAHYAAAGADVRVLTCTLGEEGEVIGDRWAQLTVDRADQLGGYRVCELTAALRALGTGHGPQYLGGAGRWRDSGMAGTPARRQPRFADADPAQAAAVLRAVIDDVRPHVVVTYDPHGGYGHPDHVQAHRVTTAAVDAPGSWPVPKLYWTVTSAAAHAAGVRGLGDCVLPAHWTRPAETVGFADTDITTTVDARDALAAKVAALAAHETQVAVSADRRAYALSNNIAQPIQGREHYVLVRGALGPPGADGREADLLAGITIAAEPA